MRKPPEAQIIQLSWLGNTEASLDYLMWPPATTAQPCVRMDGCFCNVSRLQACVCFGAIHLSESDNNFIHIATQEPHIMFLYKDHVMHEHAAEHLLERLMVFSFIFLWKSLHTKTSSFPGQNIQYKTFLTNFVVKQLHWVLSSFCIFPKVQFSLKEERRLNRSWRHRNAE